MRRQLMTTLLATLLLAGSAHAQSGYLSPGNRVRLTEKAPDGRPRVTGEVVGRSGDSVTIRLDQGGVVTPFALTNLDKLELSMGKHRNTLNGLGYGILIGGGGGALIGLIACAADSNCHGEGYELNTPQFAAFALGVVGASAGMVVGSIVGYSHQSEKWITAPPQGWRLGLAPTPQGGLSFRVGRYF